MYVGVSYTVDSLISDHPWYTRKRVDCSYIDESLYPVYEFHILAFSVLFHLNPLMFSIEHNYNF